MASTSRAIGTTQLPGYETLASHLELLLTSHSPSFIYLYDPETPRIAASAVRSVLQTVSEQEPLVHLRYACSNAVACFTPRLFYDSVINALARWTPTWEDGCQNWPGTSADGQRWNESLDTFVHGLRDVYAQVQASVHGSSSQDRGQVKGKAKARVMQPEGDEAYRLVLVIERAERLRETMPDLVVPLTRLAELAQLDIVTIFISDVRWEDIRPSLGASPEPFYMDAPLISKQATLEMLESLYPTQNYVPGNIHQDTYDPALRPLYSHFLETLYSICSPFTHDPYELAYIAAARWPGFVKPLLMLQGRTSPRAHCNADGRKNSRQAGDLSDGEEELSEIVPPTEDTRIRLTRIFTPTFTAALEALYPRLTNAEHWARANMPDEAMLAALAAGLRPGIGGHVDGALGSGVDALPRLAKFVLVAAFLASTNPPKTDMRMFGRGRDERAKRRRRRGGGPRRPKAGSTGAGVKIPQHLLGPTAFPLDRLLAILGVLLEENDAEARPLAPQFTLPGEYTDMEISRLAVYGQIMELASMRLLLRASPDKLESTPTYKCGISYETALALAKDVGIMLNDLLWEVV
ncbi:hypothetical protein POSPLADRAFT_1061624 [Postia placenta MAD-698-R-SB12]|uniref:Origin recognition complex subunit 5 n=1 Tax=Postia placenta MAD-698-R-SB12 TaxID=670580 RepID=A0A1X6MLU3_9APHY|nr:hypothetical protein POSPLADRAFT_1061624 [Postia placenta MAD-698-R-SB12]OSX57417.1 hypothetical protein POSPLADRAFT_1061624 [Postia placenta MAD-698-R-SB12]